DLMSQPPLVQMIWANPAGDLPSTGSLAKLKPVAVQLLSLQPGPKKQTLIVRVQNPTATTQRPVLTLAGVRHALGPVKPGVIATFHLGPGRQVRRLALGA